MTELLQKDGRLEALRLAKEKSATMANAVGAKLGKVLSIDEYQASTRGEQYFSNSIAQNGRLFAAGSAPLEDVASGTSAPGAVEVRVTVYAKFELE